MAGGAAMETTMQTGDKRNERARTRQRNRRTALIALSIAAAFFAGVILKRIWFG